MAFPVGWKYRAKMTIDKTKVASDQTDFPVLLAVGNIPTDALDADGGKPALNGGGDLVFTSDAAGATRLACDVQEFVIDNNPASATAEVWVKVPSVSSSVNTEFYMWWGKAAETQPARNASFGMEATWDSNYKSVYHLTEGWTTTANAYKDATASAKTGTGSVITGSPTMSGPAGKWGGKCVRSSDAASGSKVWRIACDGSSPMDYNVRGSTISAWLQTGLTGNGWWTSKGVPGSSRDWDLRGLGNNDFSGTYKHWWNRTAGDSSVVSSGGVSQNTWTHMAVTVAADGSVIFYINGSASGTHGAGTISSVASGLQLNIGTGSDNANSETWRGYVDEVRYSNSVRSANNISTTYNSTNAPATFLSYGTTDIVSRKRSGFFNCLLGF